MNNGKMSQKKIYTNKGKDMRSKPKGKGGDSYSVNPGDLEAPNYMTSQELNKFYRSNMDGIRNRNQESIHLMQGTPSGYHNNGLLKPNNT